MPKNIFLKVSQWYNWNVSIENCDYNHHHTQAPEGRLWSRTGLWKQKWQEGWKHCESMTSDYAPEGKKRLKGNVHFCSLEQINTYANSPFNVIHALGPNLSIYSESRSRGGVLSTNEWQFYTLMSIYIYLSFSHRLFMVGLRPSSTGCVVPLRGN